MLSMHACTELCFQCVVCFQCKMVHAGGRGQPARGAALCRGARDGQHSTMAGASVQARTTLLPCLTISEDIMPLAAL